jgi:hypothetical protein
MEVKRKHIIYKEEFRRQAVEMVMHSGKTQARWRASWVAANTASI